MFKKNKISIPVGRVNADTEIELFERFEFKGIFVLLLIFHNKSSIIFI